MTEYNDNHNPKSDSQTLHDESTSDQTSKVTVNNAPNENPATLWLIDDDAALRLVLADTFEDAGFTVVSFTQAQAAWTQLNDVLQHESATQLPDVILTDIRMPMMDGLSFSEWVQNHFPQLPIVIMTAHSDLTSAINSYQTGAFEYLPKPFDLDDAVATIYKAINYQPTNQINNKQAGTDVKAQAEKENKLDPKTKPTNSSDNAIKDKNSIKDEITDESNNNPNGIIGQSQAMQTVFRAIGRLAHSPITVLITGESGTGKELVASALHQHSIWRQEPRSSHSIWRPFHMI